MVTEYDASRCLLTSYLNGAVVDNQSICYFPFSPTDMFIGQRHPGWTGDSYYKGSLDEVRIYNRALSEAEVQELYAFTPPPPPPACKAVSMVYPDNSRAFGLFEGTVEDIQHTTATTSILDIQDTGAGVNYWLSIVDISPDSETSTFGPNENDPVGATLAELRLVAPGTHTSFYTSFCGPGNISFELGFDETSFLLTMANLVISVVPYAGGNVDTLIKFTSALSDIPLMVDQAKHLSAAIEYARTNRPRRAYSEITQAYVDGIRLLTNRDQRRKLFEAYQILFGLDLTWKDFLSATIHLLGAPAKILVTFSDMITLATMTGGGTKGMPVIKVVAQ